MNTAWRKAWVKSPEGVATLALYAAAEKAGMAEELHRAMVEVGVTTHTGGALAGKTVAFLVWEPELRENPRFVFPKEAFERAEKWLRAYGVKKGWEVR